jgi:hypothetical protein
MPRGDLWTLNTSSQVKRALSTECYVKTVHLECVAVAICKTASIGDNHPQTGVHPMSSGIDATDHQEVF